MNYSTVLNIGLIANNDRVHITPDNRMIPDGTLISQFYIANDNGCFSKKTI
jgi:hypothetical protein